MFSLSQSSSTSASSGSASDLQAGKPSQPIVFYYNGTSVYITAASPGTSGSQSHDETDLEELSEPPRKRARKSTGRIHSKRMRGFLAGIVNVPMDIFAQVGPPQTMPPHHVVSPADRRPLPRTHEQKIPRAANEPVGEKHLAGGRAKRTKPPILPKSSHRTTICRTLIRKVVFHVRRNSKPIVENGGGIVGLSFIPEKVHPYIRLSNVIKSSVQSSPCYGLMGDINSVVSTLFKLAAEGNAAKTDEWQEGRLEQINKEKVFGFKLMAHLNRVEVEKYERIEELKRERFTAIRDRLIEDGWEEIDCEVDFEDEDGPGVLQREWDRLVFQPKPLTSRTWENIKPKVLPIVKAYRAHRLEAEKRYRALERRVKLGELVTAIGNDEPQVIQLAPEHDQSSSQPESLTIPFPKWTHALKLWSLRQLAEEDGSSNLTEEKFMARRETIVQDLRGWQSRLAADLVERLEPRDVLSGFTGLLMCRIPWRADRQPSTEPVELSTTFTGESNRYILDRDIRTLLRADSIFEFYDYPTCYYFPEVVKIVQEKLLSPPSYIPPRSFDEGDVYGIGSLNLRGVNAHRLGRRAAKRLLTCLGKPNAAYLEMNGEEHGEPEDLNIGLQIGDDIVDGKLEAQANSSTPVRPLVKLLTIEELNALENEPLPAQFACGVCEQVADLHNGQGAGGKPIPRPQGSREVMIEHLVDVHNIPQSRLSSLLIERT
ncbi:hypothetical protein FRC11_014752 [Ceratobasidium sp. 423]|nr:hypothetical protein FRC11_014752 [Ceratobasidium sp. 423]